MNAPGLTVASVIALTPRELVEVAITHAAGLEEMVESAGPRELIEFGIGSTLLLGRALILLAESVKREAAAQRDADRAAVRH